MKIKKFSITWPEELHAVFKAVCARAKIPMNNVLRDQANKWIMVQENKLEILEQFAELREQIKNIWDYLPSDLGEQIAELKEQMAGMMVQENKLEAIKE